MTGDRHNLVVSGVKNVLVCGLPFIDSDNLFAVIPVI
jgi:hypothetical protein